MKIEKVMQQLKAGIGDATVKTAAAIPAPAPVAPAPTTGPVAEVTKLAAEVAESEKQAAAREAFDLGQAFADGVARRWSELEKAGSALPQVEKIASATARAPVSAEMMKAAEEAGYIAQSQQLEKDAQDAFQEGWIDGLKVAHHGAMVEFMKAAAVTSNIIDAAVTERQAAR